MQLNRIIYQNLPSIFRALLESPSLLLGEEAVHSEQAASLLQGRTITCTPHDNLETPMT